MPSPAPALSVVVAIVSDTVERPNVLHLRGCLRALAGQQSAPAMEIIVPHLPEVDGLEELRAEFPQVRFVAVSDLQHYTGRAGSREHHNELRARGVDAAQGQIIALVEDHGVAERDWAACMMEAHHESFAGIGGPIENGIGRPLNWAIYFCDFVQYHRPVAAGNTDAISDANVAYKRAALQSMRPVWVEMFNELTVNSHLRSRGQTLGMSPLPVVKQQRQRLRAGAALKERFIWGRSYGAARVRGATISRRLALTAIGPLIPLLLLMRIVITVLRKRCLLGALARGLPFTVALTMAWGCGEMAGYISGEVNGAATGMAAG